MKAIRAMSDGFEIEFTEPVDKRTAANPDAYAITDFTYKYHHLYGSPAIRQETRTVFKVTVSQDGTRARLFVEGMREGFVYEIKASGVKNMQGKPILHPIGYYTLNYIPDGARIEAQTKHDHAAMATVELKSAKRLTTMPSDWIKGPDQTINVGTKSGMRFDVAEITAKAGSKIKLVFNNPDDMMHNLLIVKPNTSDQVAQAAIDLGLQGSALGYVPNTDQVLFHTNLLGPNSSDIIYFVAPNALGNYGFICTFPGHGQSMRGVLKVVK
ncbi:MAG: hypothetical protein HC892_18910 [Saprospiraceae bacterium]|nr:hypothetical protein [Saprospiraceae bacterium]